MVYPGSSRYLPTVGLKMAFLELWAPWDVPTTLSSLPHHPAPIFSTSAPISTLGRLRMENVTGHIDNFFSLAPTSWSSSLSSASRLPLPVDAPTMIYASFCHKRHDALHGSVLALALEGVCGVKVGFASWSSDASER